MKNYLLGLLRQNYQALIKLCIHEFCVILTLWETGGITLDLWLLTSYVFIIKEAVISLLAKKSIFFLIIT